MLRLFAVLVLLASASAACASGFQPPTLLTLIHDLGKTRSYVEKRVDPAGLERVTLPLMPNRDLRGLTSVKHPKLVYNLRRVTEKDGGLRDTLYAILPDVIVDACHESKLRYVVSLKPLQTASDHHAVVADANPLPAGTICIETPGGHLYFTSALATRVKKPGGSWRFEKN